jgi:hypothetical protein
MVDIAGEDRYSHTDEICDIQTVPFRDRVPKTVLAQTCTR